MNCSKARQLYGAGRDGALGEADRMKLETHLARCSACAAFVREADASLDLLRGLPELSVSEGFEWNVKRRILQEKSKLFRRPEGVRFGERWWAGRFATGAVAAAAVVLAVGVFGVGREHNRAPFVKEVPARESTAIASRASHRPAGPTGVGVMETGAYVEPRVVTSEFVGRGGPGVASGLRQSPFQLVPVSREDSLTQENELLKRRIAELERQLAMYKRALYEQRLGR